jgi:hypothetical protein
VFARQWSLFVMRTPKNRAKEESVRELSQG